MPLVALEKARQKLQTVPFGVRALSAFVFGAVSTLTMPPWSAWPLLWLTFPGFLAILETAKTKGHAIVVGWTFGLGFFATGFAWIGNAFFVDRETFAALAVPAIGGLAAGFAIYIGCIGLAFRTFPRLPADAMPRARLFHLSCSIVFFAACWGLVEWWRAWFLTGFPWNPIGSVWIAVSPVMQSASLIGVYGLSIFTILAAASIRLLMHTDERKMVLVIIAACHAPLLVFCVAGILRLATATEDVVDGVMLRLVQPNIAQVDKWRPDLRQQHVLNQIAMSTLNAEAITHVLWAETAAPFALNHAPLVRAEIADAVPEGGVVLTGAPRVLQNGSERKTFNSLFAVAAGGDVLAVYDKAHLVPFGEYMPLQNLIPLPQLTGGSGFAAGPGLTSITVPGLPTFSPLICYEVIFSGAVTEPDRRPDWIFNLTNDAWFGQSSGPYQHLAAAQLRAVEEGLPVVRVANTGVSAVIDSYGRVRSQLAIGERGVIDSPLPAALEPTVFTKVGHALFFGFVVIMAGGAVITALRLKN